MAQGTEKRTRRYVRVRCEIDADGALTPIAVLWRPGRAYEITKVSRRESWACLGTGRGTRFTVWFGGYQTHLWWDTNRWYVMSRPPRRAGGGETPANAADEGPPLWPSGMGK